MSRQQSSSTEAATPSWHTEGSPAPRSQHDLACASPTAAADALIPAAAPVRRAPAATPPSSGQHRSWTPEDGPLPSLYLSHGAPMLFEMTDWMSQLHGWARSLPKPKAILIVSAHWESAPLSISTARPDRAGLRLRRLRPDVLPHALRHPGRQRPGPRGRRRCMPDGEPLHEHRSRGLDHGAWVPLKIMYPDGRHPRAAAEHADPRQTRLLALGRAAAAAARGTACWSSARGT